VTVTMVALSVACAVLTLLLVRAVRQRRHLEVAADRATGYLLGDRGASGGGDRTRRAEDSARRLERAATETAERLRAGDDEANHLRQALDGIPQGVVIADAAGRVVFRNTVAGGFARARHSDALVEAAIDEVLVDAGRGLPATRTLDLFGPPRRTLVVTGHVVGPTAALAVIEDVSERRRLDAVRRDFVANISHELRTPVGALGLLAETILGEEDPEVRARLSQRLLTETDRVARTIDDLLLLSRIESEELPEREPVAAGLVLAEAVERIRPAAGHREIGVELVEPGERLAVFGDRRQLVSALYNLLDNAVKYSDAGSTVRVRASTDGVHVDLSVRDEGVGIPEADVGRIFERFYRVDQARSRQTGGTGLGLAIVRHVATNHGGEVLVSSIVGEGSTFTLRIPSATAGPVAVRPAEAV
jgi:two-component system, OmpR family, sensor histidine kinase SenX3